MTVDTPAPPEMAAWIEETAANTRKHYDPAWCAARMVPYEPTAGHVAFRLEQAAKMIRHFNQLFVELHQQVFGGRWLDHAADCNASADVPCSCGLTDWLNRASGHKVSS